MLSLEPRLAETLVIEAPASAWLKSKTASSAVELVALPLIVLLNGTVTDVPPYTICTFALPETLTPAEILLPSATTVEFPLCLFNTTVASSGSTLSNNPTRSPTLTFAVPIAE